MPAAGAILDRLLHHAEIIAITGRSYRLQSKLKEPAVWAQHVDTWLAALLSFLVPQRIFCFAAKSKMQGLQRSVRPVEKSRRGIMMSHEKIPIPVFVFDLHFFEKELRSAPLKLFVQLGSMSNSSEDSFIVLVAFWGR